MRRKITNSSAIALAAFGLITIFLSGSIIFDLFGVRAKQGNYVSLVVWTNFICSILYMIAAYGFLKTKKWTIFLLSTSLLLLITAFIGLIIQINAGVNYETKTIGAMVFRISLTLIFSILAYYTISYFENVTHKHTYMKE